MKKKGSVLLVLLMILNGCSNTDSRDEIFRQNLYANENLSISQDEISLADYKNVCFRSCSSYC